MVTCFQRLSILGQMCKHGHMSWDQAGLHWNILWRGAQWPPRPKKRTNQWKPTFLCDWEPWETDERWMEGDTELHDSLTAEVVCGNLRHRRWDRFSKQEGFGTTGDSSACPYYLYNLVHSPLLPSPFRSCIKVWSYHEGRIQNGREKGWGSAKNQKEEESFSCLDTKLFRQKGEVIAKLCAFLINLQLGNRAKQKTAKKQEC